MRKILYVSSNTLQNTTIAASQTLAMAEEQSKYYKQALEEYQEMDQEDPDAWDKRITNTGCYVENLALQLCHAETNDWRQCLGEMKLFKECWQSKGNDHRVGTVNAPQQQP